MYSIRASNPDPHRGFGYVEFSSPEDAREAMENMHAAELYGRVIRVNAAKERKDPKDQLGSRTAVWEQVRLTSLTQLSPPTVVLGCDVVGGTVLLAEFMLIHRVRRRATQPNTMLAKK